MLSRTPPQPTISRGHFAMKTPEEKLATWTDPTSDQPQILKALKGSLSLGLIDAEGCVRISENNVELSNIDDFLQNSDGDHISDDAIDEHLWHFKVVSFPRLRLGRFTLSMSEQVLQKIQDSWNLHPKTIEIFLANNGVFTTFDCCNSGRTHFLMKVANSISTGYDCVSVTSDPARRTTYVLYHHLEDENLVFNTLLTTPERCIDPLFFVVALYQSHHQHIETHRNAIDESILRIERQTGFGYPGRVIDPNRRKSTAENTGHLDSKSTIQQLSYCQTDLAVIGHVARCCLDCGEWLIKAIDEKFLGAQSPSHQNEGRAGSETDPWEQPYLSRLRVVRSTIRQDVEHMRRRSVTASSQIQQMRERAQSQTNFGKMMNTIAQSDAEYTAAIAVDGKRDSIAMKTISILGIVFLPGTFVATLFSMDMFDWGSSDSGGVKKLTVSPSIWIYWVIVIPLTLITFLVWALWSRRENLESSKRLLIHRMKVPNDSTNATEKGVIRNPNENIV